ncbi:MAG TPA: sigma-70 family RNA polymerase sigma factor [Candidatus Binatia bacterium]|nr:sigma-70 family RNA polymerase sigma factor [Candidatus Binatia bacterium]
MERRAPRDAADDRELVARVAGGERAAFGALVERHQRMVFALAVRMTGSRDEALDVMQTTFLNAFRRIGEFRGDASFKTWLYGIALNECRMHHRRAQRTVALDAVAEPVAAVAAGDEIDRAALARLVARLPEKQRAALVLRVTEDLSFREIGAAIGSSEAAAKVNYFHAVRKLRAWVAAGGAPAAAPRSDRGES